MDKRIEILLNSKKNINSVDVDTFTKIKLFNKSSEILEYDIRNVLSATEIFDAEREANQIYKIYGKLEYMSLLNGLKNDYRYFEDFFKPQLTDSKSALNSFEYYLVVPTTGYTQATGNSNTNLYARMFKVIATPSNFEIYNAGFSNNVYGEQSYSYSFNNDYDVSGYFDDFGFPLTEMFLYSKYKPKSTETVKYSDWGNTGVATKTALVQTTLNIGDIVYGDLIEYSKPLFTQTQSLPQIYYITTPYDTTPKRIIWKYNPFISLKARYLSNDLYKANTGNTSYDITTSIPAYATNIDNNGNCVWRTILPQGYTDPLTGIGSDCPFVNKRRYLYSNILLSIVPDMYDTETRAAFAEIWFANKSTIMNIAPIGGLDNIGKPCQ